MSQELPEEIEEAKISFKGAESENDPGRKLSGYEQGFAILGEYNTYEGEVPVDIQNVIKNLKRSYTRYLIKQLAGLMDIDFITWFSYILLLCGENKEEFDERLKEEPQLLSAYNEFLRLWRQEFSEALKR